ncbi:hypothetical protein DIURU_001548 [Diutina rugosa]|uniref:Amino acid permease/ SLC12A domain-containing protein n=1 Tax=Diutina rugosa TaxID=5481 RepID=A0A642UVB8_DIURU|nr:uncharacterized protein DIURU_001548 [Diutina rugosa]KAA8905120.1 hypothetical protein DIURU_001548 [Diutina rugosa]
MSDEGYARLPGIEQVSRVAHSAINRLQEEAVQLSHTPAGRVIATILEDDDAEERVEHFRYQQDLERKLTVTSVIGLGFTVMGVPFGISSTLGISLICGGNVTLLYGWAVVSFFSTMVVLSLSEIISKYPSAGGVYHMSAILSSDRHSRASSWFTGWLLLIGNWTYAVSIMFAGSQFILSVLGMHNFDLAGNVFLTLLVYFIILALSGFIIYKFSRHLERINKACIYWTIYTVLAIDFMLMFYSRSHNSPKEILTAFDNSRSGWPDAMAFIVGLQAGSFTMSGYGMIFSLSDEVKNPEKNMPKGAVSAILMATVVGFIFIIPILTVLPSMDQLLDKNPNIMPIDLVFHIATESYIISTLLAILLVGTVIFQSIGALTTASRTVYALARDGALPYKEKFVTVDSVEEYKMPKNALFLSMVVTAIVSLLSLVSTSAFSAFLGASVMSLALANGIPIFISMLHGRKKVKGSGFRLRYFGWIVNFLAVLWVFASVGILCLPVVIRGLNAVNMNWASLVVAAFVAVASVGWLAYGKKGFVGPELDTDYINELEQYELADESNSVEVDLASNFDDDATMFNNDELDLGGTEGEVDDPLAKRQVIFTA